MVDGGLLRARDLALATSTVLPKPDQEERVQLSEKRRMDEDSSSSSDGSFESVLTDFSTSSFLGGIRICQR
jgi:hypothetical protein